MRASVITTRTKENEKADAARETADVIATMIGAMTSIIIPIHPSKHSQALRALVADGTKFLTFDSSQMLILSEIEKQKEFLFQSKWKK